MSHLYFPVCCGERVKISQTRNELSINGKVRRPHLEVSRKRFWVEFNGKLTILVEKTDFGSKICVFGLKTERNLYFRAFFYGKPQKIGQIRSFHRKFEYCRQLLAEHFYYNCAPPRTREYR